MSNIIDIIYVEYFMKRRYLILVIFLLIIFIIAGYYAYQAINGLIAKDTTLNIPNMSTENENNGKIIQIYIFTVTWCPHCVKAKPEWDKFVKDVDGTVVNGYTINCISQDCTDSTNADVINLVDKFSIEHYPTVKMMKDGNRISFEGKISEASLNKFLNAMA